MPRRGFTLMEVMVALAIFSMAVTVVFVIFSDSITLRRTSAGYAGAVALADAFLSERKLAGDGVGWFFPEDARSAVRDNRPDALGEGIMTGRVLSLSNAGRLYLLRLRAQVLEREPLVYRAFVDCSWMVREQGREREDVYALSTVFVHQAASTNR